MAPHITVTSIGSDLVRVALAGDIDAAAAAEINGHIGPLSAARAHLEVDLTATTFIDSDGVAPLLVAARAAFERGDELVVTGWSAAARHLRDALTELPHPRC